MHSRPSPVLIAVPVALLVTLLCAASAMGQIAGFTITEPVTSNPTMTGEDATFDVVAYGQTPGLTMSATYRAGDPLNNSSATTFTQTYSFGNGPRPRNACGGGHVVALAHRLQAMISLVARL